MINGTMVPKSARAIKAPAINEKEMMSKYSKQVRKGKTAKDHASGSHGSRFANRAARVEWQQDNRSTNATFPG